jgi:hypothetical protein
MRYILGKVKRVCSPVMLLVALGAAFLFGCQQPEEMTPEEVSQVEQGLCSNDMHCEFYTDSSLTTVCGERDSCINCSTSNSQWGCVGSPHRQCWSMGSCGVNLCWVCNGVTCYWETCDPR